MMVIIDKMISHALKFDPNAQRLLKKLQWKYLAITVSDFEKSFFINFPETGTNIAVTFEKPETIDATIRGPIKAFIHLALTKNTHGAAQLGLSFEGDFNTVEAVQQLFLSLDIDWEEALAPWTGDILANQLGQFARHAKNKSSALLNNTAESLSEYLKEESGLLPTRIEINNFMDKVDVLRSDTDRLEARLLQLQLSEAIS